MKIFYFFFLLFFVSCKKPVGLTKEDMYKRARAVNSTFEVILSTREADKIDCKKYPPGCIYAYRGGVKDLRLDMIFINYDTADNARLAAAKIDQYYIENWVIDEVADEPLLEKFILKAYPEAVRPLKSFIKPNDNQINSSTDKTDSVN